jgi:hypothetical protein
MKFLICSYMCKRLSSNSLIKIREREKKGRSTFISLYTYMSSRPLVFFRKRLTTYACSHSIPYISNMVDCSVSSVSFSYNNNRDELEALIYSHTSILSLFSYIHIWTPTLRCCRGGGVVVGNVLIDLSWLNRERRQTKATHRYCFVRFSDRDYYSLLQWSIIKISLFLFYILSWNGNRI